MTKRRAGNSRSSQRALVLLARMVALAATLGLALPSLAREDGIAGRTSGCTACHGGSNGSATFSIDGVSTVFEGETVTYQARVVSGAFPNGACGVDVGATAGNLSESSASLKLLSSEVVHSAPIPFAGAPDCGDSFEWTAPLAAAASSADLVGAGLAANGDGGSGGDISSTTSKTVAIVATTGEPALLFEAIPPRVLPGESTTLHWRTDGVATCLASGDWSGARSTGLGQSEVVTPGSAVSVYTLNCENAGGTESVERTVTVRQLGVAVVPPGGFPISFEPGIDDPSYMVVAPGDAILLTSFDDGGTIYRTLDGMSSGNTAGDGEVFLDDLGQPYYFEFSQGTLVSLVDPGGFLGASVDLSAFAPPGGDMFIRNFAFLGPDLTFQLSAAGVSGAAIYRVDAATATASVLFDYTESQSPLTLPIAEQGDGSLLFTLYDQAFDPSVVRITPEGQTDPIAAQGVGSLAPDGGLIVSDCDGDRVYREPLDGSDPIVLIDSAGDGQTPVDCPGAPRFDSERNLYLFANQSAIWRVGTDGSVAQLVPAGVLGDDDCCNNFAVDGSGNIFVAGKRQFSRISTRTFAIATAADGLDQPGALAVDEQGNVYVASTATNEVFRIEPDGSVVLYMNSSGQGLPLPGNEPLAPVQGGLPGQGGLPLLSMLRPEAIAVGPDQSLYVAGADSDNVIRVQPDGSSVVVATGDGAHRLAVANDGTLYVAFEGSDDVLRYPPGGGSDVVIGAAGDGAGNALTGVSALAVSSDGTLYAAGADSDNVLKFTGSAVELVLDATGDGVAPLDQPMGLVAGDDSQLFVTGFASDNVFRVDSEGGVSLVLDASGDGLVAPFAGPGQPALDETGVLYVPSAGASDLFEVHFAEPGGSASGPVSLVRRAVASTGDGVEALTTPERATAAPGSGVYFTGRASDNAFFYRPFDAVQIPEPDVVSAGLAALLALGAVRCARRRRR